jgi:hypothetical protein
LKSFQNPEYGDFALVTGMLDWKSGDSSYIVSHKYSFMVLLDPQKANDQYTITIYPQHSYWHFEKIIK